MEGEKHIMQSKQENGVKDAEKHYESRVGGRDARKNGADGRAVSRCLGALD